MATIDYYSVLGIGHQAMEEERWIVAPAVVLLSKLLHNFFLKQTIIIL